MASSPKKPKQSAPKMPANDPMLDAIRNGGREEPDFGASPGAMQAANAVLMANIRSKLGQPAAGQSSLVQPGAGPVYAGPASAMPKMAVPTIELPVRPEAPKPEAPEPEFSHAPAEETPAEEAPEQPAAGEIDFTDAAADPALRKSDAPMVLPEHDQETEETEVAATETPLPEATALSDADVLAPPAAPETTFTENPAADAPSGGAAAEVGMVPEPVEPDATPAPEAEAEMDAAPPYRSVFDGPEEEDEDWVMRPARISPASLRTPAAALPPTAPLDETPRIAPAHRTAVAFGDVSTTSERAARAFPHLADEEFVGGAADEAAPPADPYAAPYADWRATQSPGQRRRWRWALAGLLVAGVGINAFLLRETDTTKPSAAMRQPEPPPMAARFVPPTSEAMTPEPPPAAPVHSPNIAPAKIAPAHPAPVHAAPAAIAPIDPAPAQPASIDPQRLLRLLSRP